MGNRLCMLKIEMRRNGQQGDIQRAIDFANTVLGKAKLVDQVRICLSAIY